MYVDDKAQTKDGKYQAIQLMMKYEHDTNRIMNRNEGLNMTHERQYTFYRILRMNTFN